MKINVVTFSIIAVQSLVFLNCSRKDQLIAPQIFVEPANLVETYFPLEPGAQWQYSYVTQSNSGVAIGHTGTMFWTVGQKQFFQDLIVYTINVRKDDVQIIGGLCEPNPGSPDTVKTTEEYQFDISVDGAGIAFSGDRLRLDLVTDCLRDSVCCMGVPDTIRYACRKECELTNDIVLVRNVGIASRVYRYHDLTGDFSMTLELLDFKGS